MLSVPTDGLRSIDFSDSCASVRLHLAACSLISNTVTPHRLTAAACACCRYAGRAAGVCIRLLGLAVVQLGLQIVIAVKLVILIFIVIINLIKTRPTGRHQFRAAAPM